MPRECSGVDACLPELGGVARIGWKLFGVIGGRFGAEYAAVPAGADRRLDSGYSQRLSVANGHILRWVVTVVNRGLILVGVTDMQWFLRGDKDEFCGRDATDVSANDAWGE